MDMQFLIDIGACCSLLPRPLSRTRRSLSKAANVFGIPTHSYKSFTLSFRSVKYHQKFLVADVPLPILGANFLSPYQLLVDGVHRWLLNAEFCFSIPLQPAPFDLALPISAHTDVYSHLLMAYPEVFCPEFWQTSTVLAKHGICHHIKMTATLAFARIQYLAKDCLAATK
ncbi:uncharacterized protein [Palaemon carinicauda]|uniref:uncharacterized protein n=1 Tax=Palaemon carinicauda TaxID=392227 RepID=UPI0035B5BC36